MLPGAPDRGTLFDAGPDFYAVGRQSGCMAADVLDGADMTKMPIRDVLDVIPPYLSVNTNGARRPEGTVAVPPDVLAEATVVVDDTGVHRKDAQPRGRGGEARRDRSPSSGGSASSRCSA